MCNEGYHKSVYLVSYPSLCSSRKYYINTTHSIYHPYYLNYLPILSIPYMMVDKITLQGVMVMGIGLRGGDGGLGLVFNKGGGWV